MALNTRIILSAQDRGVGRAFSNLGKQSSKAQRKVFGVNSALKQTNSSLVGLSATMRTAVGVLGVGGLVAGFAALTKQSLAVKIDFDRINNTLKAVAGGSSGAAQEMGFLTSEAKRLGIELRPLGQTYSRLLASTKALGFSSKDTQEIFSSFSEALTSFGASGQQSIRVFSALEQISSKGNVSMEEIRQQLGEALPGALSLAAKAMNVTEEEFQKLVAQGKIASKDFLIPFARVVREDLGKGAVGGAKLLNAQINRLTNAGEQLFKSFGDGLEGGLVESIKEFTSAFDDKDAINGARLFGEEVGGFLREGTKLIITFSKEMKGLIPILTQIAKGFAAIAAFKGVRAILGAAGSFGARRLGATAVSSGGAARAPVSSSFGPARVGAGHDFNGRARAAARTRRFRDAQFARTAPRENKFTSLRNLNGIASGGGKSIVPPRVKLGLKKFGNGIAKGATSLVNFLGPLNLLTAGAIAATVAFNDFKVSQRKEEAANKEGKLAESKTQLFNAQRTGTGSVSDRVLAVAGAFDVASKGLDIAQFDKLKAEMDAIIGRIKSQFRPPPSAEENRRKFNDAIRDAGREADGLLVAFKESREIGKEIKDVGERIKKSTGLEALGPELTKLAGELLKRSLSPEQIAKRLKPLAAENQSSVLAKQRIKDEKDRASIAKKLKEKQTESFGDFVEELRVRRQNNATLKKLGEVEGQKVNRQREIFRSIVDKTGIGKERAAKLARALFKAEQSGSPETSKRLATVQTLTSDQGARALFSQKGINAPKPKTQEKKRDEDVAKTAKFAEQSSDDIKEIKVSMSDLALNMRLR